MKLIEYLELRNGKDRHGGVIKAMTKGEGRILGVEMNKRGWAKSPQEYSEEQIKSCMLYVLKCDWVKLKIKNRVADLFKNTQFSIDDQKLYLLRNSQGMFKIGISKNPFKRASTLSNSSGYKIEVQGVWEMVSARKQEQELHKIFDKHRQVGEWFSCDFTIDSLESHMSQDFNRVYSL